MDENKMLIAFKSMKHTDHPAHLDNLDFIQNHYKFPYSVQPRLRLNASSVHTELVLYTVKRHSATRANGLSEYTVLKDQ